MSEERLEPEGLRREALFSAVLFRALARGDSVPRDRASSVWGCVDEVVLAMVREGLLAEGQGAFLLPTAAALEAYARLASLLQVARALELLATVNLTVELDDEVSDDGEDARPDVLDPRFTPPRSGEEAEQQGTEDMRFAVLTWLARDCGASRAELDPRVGWILLLAEGRLDDDTAWFDIAHGALLLEVEERVKGAYPYDNVADDVAEVNDIIAHIYEAAVIERRKRMALPPLCVGCREETAPTSLWCEPCAQAFRASLASPLA